MNSTPLAEVVPPATLSDAIKARIQLRSPRRQRFVEHFVLHGNAAQAARAAGYSQRSAQPRSSRLLRCPAIAAAITEARRALAEAAAFTVERAMDQLREDRQFAIKTENATAAVRASELMAKMSGHLVERIDARVAVGFSVNLHIPGAPHD